MVAGVNQEEDDTLNIVDNFLFLYFIRQDLLLIRKKKEENRNTSLSLRQTTSFSHLHSLLSLYFSSSP